MRRMLLACVCVFAAVVSQSASAGVVLVRCEGCSSSQYRLTAESLGIGEHYLYSLSTREIHKFLVLYDAEFDVRQVEEGIVESDVSGAFGGLLEIYDKSNGTMGIQVEIDSQGLDLIGLGTATTFDVMGDANLRARLGDRLAQGNVSELYPLIDLFIKVVLAMANQGPVFIEFGVRMWDGSLVVYRWDAGTRSATYLYGRSRMADGQVIPEANSQEFAGRWVGDENDLAGLLDHLGRLGVTIIKVSSSVGSMDCTWDGATLTCKLT